MKRKLLCTLIGIGLFTANLKAQNSPTLLERKTNDQGQTISVYKAAQVGSSVAVRDLPVVNPQKNSGKKKGALNKKKNRPVAIREGLPNGLDPALQMDGYNKRPSKAPLVNFTGITDPQGSAMDPSGAVGPNHYIEATNWSFQIWDKTGNSLSGPHALSKLWPNYQDVGDPIVMYDKYADRWFISQFNDAPNGMLLAVSKTADPLGEYHTYQFTTTEFPDYPKFGIWHDGYYMTSNSSHSAVVFEREKMLTGDQSAKAIILEANNLNNGSNMTVVLPSYIDGELPPSDVPCYFFSLQDDAWGASEDAIQIYEFKTDWTTTTNSAVTFKKNLKVDNFAGQIASESWEDIPQKGTTQKLDAGENMLMYRAQYRKWIGYNTVLLSHVVNADGNDKGGIRWYELRDENDGNWKVYQQGTYAPDEKFRCFSGLSMDNQGNIGMAYATSSANDYVSLAYTGRMKGDPLGTMTLSEEVAAVGTGAQTGGERFCDYVHMTLDPEDDQTFWHVGQYVGDNGEGKTQIFAFKLALATSIDNVYHSNLSSKLGLSNNNLTLQVEGLYNNDKIQVDLFTVNGKLISSSFMNPINNSFQSNFNIGELSTGVYFIRFGNKNFQHIEKFNK